MRNPYETLGVAEDAPLATIKTRHRQLVRRYHPHGPQPNAALMAETNAAWNQLKTAQARADTDAKLGGHQGRTTAGDNTRRPPTGKQQKPSSGTKGWGEATGSPQPEVQRPASPAPPPTPPPKPAAKTDQHEATSTSRLTTSGGRSHTANSPPRRKRLSSHRWRRGSGGWRCDERTQHSSCGPKPRRRAFPQGYAWVYTHDAGAYDWEHHSPPFKTSVWVERVVVLVLAAWIVRLGVFRYVDRPDWLVPFDWGQNVAAAGVALFGFIGVFRIKFRPARLLAWVAIGAATYEISVAAVRNAPTLWEHAPTLWVRVQTLWEQAQTLW